MSVSAAIRIPARYPSSEPLPGKPINVQAAQASGMDVRDRALALA